MQNIHFSKFANMSAVAFCLLAVAMLLVPAGQARAQALAKHTPDKVLSGSALLVSHYAPVQKLRLVLGIQPPHMAEEEQFISDLVTKSSPNFHKFLTPEEWNARFAPSVEDEQKVVDWVESQGLTVTQRYPNRLLVAVEGTSGAIEKAFGVTINNYQVGDEVDFSNDRDPIIPAHLSGIVSTVVGLNSVERVHRVGHANTTVKGADYDPGPLVSAEQHAMGVGDPAKAKSNRSRAVVSEAESHPADSYSLDCSGTTCAANPINIQSSEGYDYTGLQRFSHCCNVHNDSNGSPNVSSIALIGYGAFNLSDVEEFDNFYGYAWKLTWACYGGGSCPGVDGEAPLDVEYAGAMSNTGNSNTVAHIYEYEMDNNLYTTYESTFNQILSDNKAKVVSTSYVFTENTGFSGSVATGSMHPIFNNMIGEGFTLIAASGDNGASAGCGNATALEYPASDPDFLAAGGTQLLLNSSGIYQSEIGWQGENSTSGKGSCSTNHGGSTGGVSVLFQSPWWQNKSNVTVDVVSPYYDFVGTQEYVVTGNTYRMVPDMALTANPDVMGEWYYSGGSWGDEGGTSIVAPELAGFFAQYNTYLNYIGNICGSGSSACAPVGLPTPFMYENAANNAAHQPFYDMLSGCNDNNVTAADNLAYYCAHSDFDEVTGWGSANMMQLAWGLSYQVIPAYGQPVINFTGPTKGQWYNSDQEVNWTVSDSVTNSTTLPPPGVAGFTQGWDSIPADPYSEAHSGEDNSFYSGPYYAFGTTGCLSIEGKGGCSYISSGAQGCHTVWVEGWDNTGVTATNSYGPVCVDTVAPTISVSTNPSNATSAWVNKNVVVTLTATDPGGSNASGIKKTYYALNSFCNSSSLSSCSVYSGPFTLTGSQESYIWYFTEDNAGNFSNESYFYVYIDESTPVTTATPSGTVYSGSTYDSAVSITLHGTDSGGSGIARTYYILDGGSTTTYTVALNVTALGNHTLQYWSVNNAGTTESANSWSFTIASPTTTTLTASPSPSVVGQPVTLKATVAAIYSGTPTGSVTFWYGNSNLGTGTLSGGVATLVTSALPSGTLTLKATYSGPYYFITSSGTASLLVKRTQTITFPALTSPVKYGVAPITLSATASSGLAVTYSVIGPATMDGTHTLKIIGVGTVEVKAMQVGDNGYAAATPVSHSILVGKASLTIHANNATVALDQPIPALTYTLTGFVNGDKASVVTGAPDETTTAKEGSAAGHYTIKITQGTLSAANYGGWATVNGTLTITAATSDPAPPSTSVQ